jgi:hypothetical protein
VTTQDPFTGKVDSRYAKCEATGTCPLAVEIYSANEYWVKTGLAAAHDARRPSRPAGFAVCAQLPDLEPPARTGNAANRGDCQQFQNPLNSAPIQRALFLALDDWTNGIEPPASRVPRLSDGTLVKPRPQSSVGFPSIPGVTYTGLQTTRYLYDYGPNFYTTGSRRSTRRSRRRHTRTTRCTGRSIRATCRRPTPTATTSPACGCPT